MPLLQLVPNTQISRFPSRGLGAAPAVPGRVRTLRRPRAPEAGGAAGPLATQGQLRQRHGLMGEVLRGQHGEGMTWGGGEQTLQTGPEPPEEHGRPAATHCRCSREAPPCAPVPDCRTGSNGGRRAGPRGSGTEGAPGEPRYAEACAFYVLLCSFETTPMKTQRNKTSWSSTRRHKRV